MANVEIPSPAELRQLLRYEPETGNLYWKHRSPMWFRDTAGRTAEHACCNWNSRYAGREAFIAVDGHGYLVGSVRDRKLKAHRVIWAMLNDEWPIGDVDHINLDRRDNRAENLRVATRSENMRNRGATKSNSTGLKGVCWDSGKRKWLAQIRIHGRNRYLGRYDSPQAAHIAYTKAAATLHGEFAKTE